MRRLRGWIRGLSCRFAFGDFRWLFDRLLSLFVIHMADRGQIVLETSPRFTLSEARAVSLIGGHLAF